MRSALQPKPTRYGVRHAAATARGIAARPKSNLHGAGEWRDEPTVRPMPTMAERRAAYEFFEALLAHMEGKGKLLMTSSSIKELFGFPAARKDKKEMTIYQTHIDAAGLMQVAVDNRAQYGLLREQVELAVSRLRPPAPNVYRVQW